MRDPTSIAVPHGVVPTPRRRPKYSVRAFWVSILLISCIAVISLLAGNGAHNSRGEDGGIRRRELVQQAGTRNSSAMRPKQDFQDCRLVHKAVDKCAYVHSNCPDEEAGLFSYLSLYYCSLPHAKPVAFIILAVWLGLLFSTIGIAASDFFCINLSTISSILGMSESMAGVTFLAFGNGSPDVFSTFAAMGTHSGSLAVGELIGAAGFITAVVAGSMALVRPFQVARKSFVRDVGFFIVAVSFSMVFLADGSLRLWECIVMVGFYVFYVAVVVVWHWWLGRRRERKARDAAARREYFLPDDQEIQTQPDPDEEDADEGTSLLAHTPNEDFGALERGASPMITPMDEDDEEEARDRWLAELNSNMRVSRPPRGERRNTINPIRPSLVGALEFRAVLSALHKSQHMQTIPLTPPPNIRRFSDDPALTLAQQQSQMPAIDNPDLAPNELDNPEDEVTDLRPSQTLAANRRRAVSTNDALALHLRNQAGAERGSLLEIQSQSPSAAGRPSHSHSPPALVPKWRQGTPAAPRLRIPSPDLLSPPHESRRAPSQSRGSPLAFEYRDSPADSPKTRSQQIPTLNLPPPAQEHGPDASGPESPFPTFSEGHLSTPTTSRAPSIRLPSPSLSPVSFYHHQEFGMPETNPISWWPYKLLPPPRILASTLFPTLYSWNDKNIWEKFLGVIAAPSVFVLAITLPVVESDKDDDTIEAYVSDPALLTPDGKISRSRRGTITILPADSPDEEETNEWRGFQQATQTPAVVKDETSHRPASRESAGLAGLAGHGNTASTATSAEDRHQQQIHQAPNAVDRPASPPQTLVSPRVTKKEWNRWLVCIQIVTAPFFIVVIVWANMTPEPMDPRTLLRPVLFTLLGSLVTLVLLFLTTSSSQPPRWHPLFCFVGFVVSISWISTIANEVVGVLKAFGIILNISDAILGLTIFAVGNSLGDLVADVTVARLGYPVMALSACFGGPMLNILLGIGISGLYLTLRKGQHWHDKHPDRPTKYKPYQIEVSSTLMISAITLLITLVALLIVVPLNGWKMDRKIGWGLIAIWCISTVGNLVVEIAGYGGDYT